MNINAGLCYVLILISFYCFKLYFIFLKTKTDMEPATVEDLERASAQGTILAVKMNGKVYGKGGIDWHDDAPRTNILITTSVAVAVLLVLVLLICKYKSSIIKMFKRLQSRRFHHNLRKALFEDDGDNELDDDLKNELGKKQRMIEELEWELQQEHTIREMEWQVSRQKHLQCNHLEDEDEDLSIDDGPVTDSESSVPTKEDDIFSDEHTTDDDEDKESSSSIEGGDGSTTGGNGSTGGDDGSITSLKSNEGGLKKYLSGFQL
jgi:uncharacterized membrane protein YgcG